jgi:transcriptional regulator with XRE-family HTH domain
VGPRDDLHRLRSYRTDELTGEGVAGIDKRRLEFGDRLRTERKRVGLTGRVLAHQLGWQQSKVSRIENGKQTPTDFDVRQWLDQCGASESVVTQLTDDLRDLRVEYDSWQRQLRYGLSPRQERSIDIERDAHLVRMVEISSVPGLVQTSEYARNVFEIVSELHETERDIDKAVAARLERQRVLYDSTKRFEILVAEAALRYPFCSPGAMAAQIDRLMTVAELPNVRFGVLALDTRLPAVPMHGYWIIDDRAMVETVAGEITTLDPDDVALYRRLTDRLWEAAAEGDEARSILVACARRWAERVH